MEPSGRLDHRWATIAHFISTLCAPDLKRPMYCTHFPPPFYLLLSLELYFLINDIWENKAAIIKDRLMCECWISIRCVFICPSPRHGQLYNCQLLAIRVWGQKPCFRRPHRLGSATVPACQWKGWIVVMKSRERCIQCGHIGKSIKGSCDRPHKVYFQGTDMTSKSKSRRSWVCVCRR